MLPSASPGWNGIQALQSHLKGRLEGFVRNRTRYNRAGRIDNEAAFLEADLHYVLHKAIFVAELSTEDFHGLETKAQDLLDSLNQIVNEDFVEDNEQATNFSEDDDEDEESAHETVYGIALLSSAYPKLARLIHALDTSTGRFTLISSTGPSLFSLPSWGSRSQIMNRVAQWKSFLDQLEAKNGKPWSASSPPYLSKSSASSKTMASGDKLQKRASIVVTTIFKEFQRLKCRGEHELKVRLSEKWYTSPSPTAVEMFISCCQSPGNWHEAQCANSGRIVTNPEREEDICRAIDDSRKQSTKLYLHVDERGLCNITNHLPSVATSGNDYESESLDSLIEQKAFSRLSPKDYWDGTAIERFDVREKAALALVLSRCLMDFFDEDVELASYAWNPEKIFFLRSRRAGVRAHPVYVSLKPSSAGSKSLDFFRAVRPGNPILLSFAKLLLEIHCGERIPMEIQQQSTVNIPGWGHLCDFLLEAQRDEASHYLEAVEGCLNLHKYLLKYREGQSKMTGRDFRRVIYEQVVGHLEHALNPTSSKRKRSDDMPELQLAKKASLIKPRETAPDRTSESPIADVNNHRHSNSRRQVHRPEGTDSLKTAAGLQLGRDIFSKADKQTQHPSRSLNGISPPGATCMSEFHGSFEDSISEVVLGVHDAEKLRTIPKFTHQYATDVSNGRRTGSASVESSIEREPNPFAKYKVAIICAIEFEMSAFRYMLDAEHPSLPRKEGDSNIYILGELQHHNIVLACLPGSQGKGSAAIVVTHLVRTFPCIEWRFMVGIGGGVPSAKHDIRLGDVVVSMPEGCHGGVVQYDLGKDTGGKFGLKGFLTPPPPLLRSAVLKMRSDHRLRDSKVNEFLSGMLQRGQRLSIYQRPPDHTDVLFRTEYCHGLQKSTCEECDHQQMVQRPSRKFQAPEIHYGLIASGDRVIRSAANRNEIIREIGDILCFEMEAAGLATEHSCIIIRGISDYSDSHKNDEWQHYAAATAAACAKELLLYVN
ncbi:hypothetical protein S40288_08175 [Stachybotrys chartarum IBT 40288]|nr:hypothetical protein S40288_08175 [Stachybotrys chartarum IBT 40288]